MEKKTKLGNEVNFVQEGLRFSRVIGTSPRKRRTALMKIGSRLEILRS